VEPLQGHCNPIAGVCGGRRKRKDAGRWIHLERHTCMGPLNPMRRRTRTMSEPRQQYLTVKGFYSLMIKAQKSRWPMLPPTPPRRSVGDSGCAWTTSGSAKVLPASSPEMGVAFWIDLVEGTYWEVAEAPIRRWPKGTVWVAERYPIGYGVVKEVAPLASTYANPGGGSPDIDKPLDRLLRCG
jgi:hypothetical protein